MFGKEKTVEASQLRSFGLLVGGIFAIIGVWPLLLRGDTPRLWILIVSGILIVSALLLPSILKPIYLVWMRLGAILGWVNTRIILAIGFFLVFSPMGWVMRLFGRDALLRKLDPTLNTYRVPRSSKPGLHLERQF